MKHLYKVQMDFMHPKTVLITANTEMEAINMADSLWKDPDFSEKEWESISNFLIEQKRITAKEILPEDKPFPYYVTTYSLYPIYEPAEGGYYYNGVQMVESSGFQTRKKANKHIRKMYKKCVANGNTKEEGWYCNNNHTFFGCNGEYIGDGWFIQLERKQGQSESGWQPYC